MDIHTFEEIASEDRYEIYHKASDIIANFSRKRRHKMHHECPRCGNWKLTAHDLQEKQKKSRGFLRGSDKVWVTVDRWWECKNCNGEFDVLQVEDSQTDKVNKEEAPEPPNTEDGESADDDDAEAKPESTNTEDSETADDEDGEAKPEKYELEFLHVDGNTMADNPIIGGESAIVLSGHVKVPAKSATFRFARGHNCSDRALVRMVKEEDRMFCIVEESN